MARNLNLAWVEVQTRADEETKRRELADHLAHQAQAYAEEQAKEGASWRTASLARPRPGLLQSGRGGVW